MALQRIPTLAVLAATAAAVAAGCGSSSSSSSSPSGSSGGSSAPSSSAAPAASPPKATTGSGSVTISETEFMLMPMTVHVHSGRVVLRIRNAGTITHALAIEHGGPGGKDARSADISPGSSATLVANLKKGSYEIYCPVGNHKSLGMKGTLAVS